MIGPETDQAGFVDRIGGLVALDALRLQREIDHHDGVLLHDTDQHDDADEGVDVQLVVEDQQRGQRAQPGRGQAGKNRDGMDEALVQNAQHHVDHQDRHREQDAHALQRRLKRRGHALEAGADVVRQGLARHLLHAVHGLAQRDARLQVERNRDRRQLAQVRHRQRADSGAELRPPRSAGSSLPLDGAHVEQVRALGIALKLRQHSRITQYVVDGRVDGRDLARAVGVVERDSRSGSAVTPSADARSRSISTITCGLEICRSLFTS